MAFAMESLSGAVDFSKFAEVTKLFESFNMDALHERLQEEESLAVIEERERRGIAPVPLPQLPGAGSGATGGGGGGGGGARRSVDSRRESVSSIPQYLAEGPGSSADGDFYSRRASVAPGGDFRRPSMAPGREAAARMALDAAGPAAVKAAEAAFFADMSAAGLDPNAPSDPSYSEPPTMHAFYNVNINTPGFVGKKSAAPPGGAAAAPAAPAASAGDIFATLNLDAASTVFEDAVARAKYAAAGVADSFGGVAAAAAAAAPQLAAPAAAAAAAGDWLRGYVTAASGGAASAAAPPTPGSLRRGPGATATNADRSIFSILSGADRSGASSATEMRDGIPISSFSRWGSGAGIAAGMNPALLSAGSSSAGAESGAGSAAGACSALSTRVEAACGPAIGPICCALVPLSFCVRSVAVCGAAVAACAGCSAVSSALRHVAFNATPRAVFLALLLFAAAYILWHWGIMGSDGALEWSEKKPQLQGAVLVNAVVGGLTAQTVPGALPPNTFDAKNTPRSLLRGRL
jgi:hypothetical protein